MFLLTEESFRGRLCARGTPLMPKKEEGMPSIDAIDRFVRKEPITPEEWIELIQARRARIKPHLDSFTLSALGCQKWMMDEGFQNVMLLQDVDRTTGDGQFALETQGIFHLQRSDAFEEFWTEEFGHRVRTGGVKRGWGLTRAGLWVLIEASYVATSGHKNRGRELASRVEVAEADIPTILEKTKCKPEEVWRSLSDAIQHFVEKRKRLYDAALALGEVIRCEDLVYSRLAAEK